MPFPIVNKMFDDLNYEMIIKMGKNKNNTWYAKFTFCSYAINLRREKSSSQRVIPPSESPRTKYPFPVVMQVTSNAYQLGS